MFPLLEARGLTAGYGEVRVLHELDIAFAAGSITAVIGSNGAGKTTLMRALAGLIPATAGQVLFDQCDVTARRAHQRVVDGIALVPEGRLVFPDLTVAETLRIGAYARPMRQGWQQRAEAMYTMFPRLQARRHSRAGTLSGGEQQMLALARGLMAKPRVLLLDEPSLGLAPALADEVFARLRVIRDQGVTIGIVEQNVYAALSLADYAYVLERGVVIAEGSGAALMDLPAIRESYLGL